MPSNSPTFEPTESPVVACVDTADGATDPWGDGCEWYDSNTWGCGGYDSDTFQSEVMCCACGGGRLEVPTVSPTLEPTKDPAFTPTEEPTTPPTTSQPTRSPVEGLNINYVTMGMTTAVKNQGGCGSCWAFAASEVLESAMLIAGTANAGVNLSEQELVSCSDAGSCSGGWPWESWTWIQSSTNGLAADSTFEYTATDSDCTIDPSTDGVIDAMPSEIWAATTWCYSGAC